MVLRVLKNYEILPTFLFSGSTSEPLLPYWQCIVAGSLAPDEDDQDRVITNIAELLASVIASSKREPSAQEVTYFSPNVLVELAN